MSEEQLKAFWEAIQADTALQQKLQGVTDPDAIVAIAKEAGFSISADELKKAMESVELSEEQLEAVSGGICAFCDGACTV
jgi:predicted ribosomally synthesized peptide with nif11-like leader